MKAKKVIILVIGLFLLGIFLSLMFTFQVRNTEIALVRSLQGDPRILNGNNEDDAGFHIRWPWPFETVRKLDGRVHIMESNYAQLGGSSGGDVMASVYVGWKVSDAEQFRVAYEGQGDVKKMMEKAERDLRNVVEKARGNVFGTVKILSLLSPDVGGGGNIAYEKLENDMKGRVEAKALTDYGIEIQFLGIRRIGLSPTLANSFVEGMAKAKKNLTAAVTMKTQSEIQSIQDISEKEANDIVAEAENRARVLVQEAENNASIKYQEMEKKHPKLAIALKTIRALEVLSANPTTLILTDKSPIVSLLSESGFSLPTLPQENNGTVVIPRNK